MMRDRESMHVKVQCVFVCGSVSKWKCMCVFVRGEM